MSKFAVAVCDTDDEYRDRFVTYLVEHKSGELAVHAFSTPELFLNAVEGQQFDVAVLGKGFGEAERVVRKLGVPVLLLQENIPVRVAESSGYQAEPPGYQAEECGACISTFRYQPMEAIWHDIQVLAGGRKREKVEMGALMEGIEVIGVYSPVRHEMQMPFAMVLTELLSENRKVLYVNLMEHSGFLELFQLAGEYDFGDIILRLRNKRLQPAAFLRSVYGINRMYYIPPFGNPENLHDFTMEDYLAFLGFLEEQSDFDTVVFDFGDGMSRFAGMLEHCTTIYCPVKAGFFFECQMNHFLEYLDIECGAAFRERLHILNLPFSAKRIRGGEVRRQLLWSEFGDYVRGYLTGGGL